MIKTITAVGKLIGKSIIFSREAIAKSIVAGLGSLTGFLMSTFPFFALIFFFVMFDMYTSFRLAKKVHKVAPELASGKFESSKAKKSFRTLLEAYTLIMLAFFADAILFPEFAIYAANMVAGAFVFIHSWSILENLSSCGDSKIAMLLQKVMVNKAERHFDVNLDEFKHKETVTTVTDDPKNNDVVTTTTETKFTGTINN